MTVDADELEEDKIGSFFISINRFECDCCCEAATIFRKFDNELLINGEEGDDEPVVANVAAAAAPADNKNAQPTQELDADGNPIASDDEDDEDEQANMSLAAMEAALKPRVLEILDNIARDYTELADMQDERMSATLNEDGSFSASDEARYQKLRSEIVEF